MLETCSRADVQGDGPGKVLYCVARNILNSHAGLSGEVSSVHKASGGGRDRKSCSDTEDECDCL